MKKTPAFSLLFVCSFIPHVSADIVMLKTGFSEIAGSVTGNAREVSVRTADGVKAVPLDQVFSIRFGAVERDSAASPRPAPGSAKTMPPGAFQSITIPAGTPIAIRTIDAIDSKTADTRREYAASLDEPLVVFDRTIAPAKVNAVLKIGEIKQAGRLKGSATLSLRLIALTINGQRVVVETGEVASSSSGKGKTTARDGAIGSAGGCGIGAVVGGALGCGVGGALGGAIGIGTSALAGKDVKIAPETRLTFKLAKPVVVGVAVEPTTDQPQGGGAETRFEAALGRGKAHWNAAEFDEALQEYRAALAINGKSSLAHYFAGQIFVQQKNSQAAGNEFDEALKGDLDPGWLVVWAHIRLAQNFDRTGERQRAVNEYIEAVRTGDNTYSAQSFATGYLRTPCRAAVCPDTLTLRDGASVTGNWLSVDADKIYFLTDDRPRTYLKSDVLVVTFGSGGLTGGVAAAPAVTPVAVDPVPTAPVQVQSPSEASGTEPEWVGAVYFRDASGKFIPLERSTATNLPAGAGVGYSPNRLYRDFYVVEGLRSSVRLQKDQTMAFVVRLANGVDPRVFNLYPLDARKGARGTRLDPKKKIIMTLPLNVTRAGASSYGLIPEGALPVGEYAFSPKGSNDTYCFGVDP